MVKPYTKWTDVMDDILVAGLAVGMTRREIGEELGLDQSVISTRVNHLRVKGRLAWPEKRSKKRAAAPEREPERDLGKKDRRGVVHSDRGYIKIKPGQGKPVPVASFKTCQWLEGEPRDRNFCAAPVQVDSPYCPEHHAICYEPPRDPLNIPASSWKSHF